MKPRCLLIDDEPHAIEVLESHIRTVGTLEIVARCHNAIAAFEVLQREKVDLLFLDIKMPKLLGTDFLKALHNPPKVIFTTAYREYALDGFELDVVDYLLKPISLERFLKAIHKANLLDGHEAENMVAHKEAYQPNQEAFLYFRVDRQMVKILLKEVVYVESLKDYVRIVTKARQYVTKQKISSLEHMLPESQFVRIHRSFIVALDKIDTFRADTVGVGGKELPIGRNYRHEIQRLFKPSLS
jgi:DNA-binding LytR/AlgR family response regulator